MARARRQGVLKASRIKFKIGDMLEDHDVQNCHEVLRIYTIPNNDGRLILFKTVNPDLDEPFFHSAFFGCPTAQPLNPLLETADVVRRGERSYQLDPKADERTWREVMG